MVEEDVDDQPRTTNGSQFDVLQSILLPFLMRCGSGMKTHDPHRVSPEQREFLQEACLAHTVLAYNVASSLVCTSQLGVITIVGLLDVLMVSNSAELKSFLLAVCILAPESTTNSHSSGSFVDAAASLVFFFELANVFWQDSTPCFGHIAAVVQSLRGTCLQISPRRDFADDEL